MKKLLKKMHLLQQRRVKLNEQMKQVKEKIRRFGHGD